MTLDAVQVSAGWGDHVALRDVTLTVGRGEIVGLSGPSGGGKTTLALTVAGLIPPLAGVVTINGVPLRGHRRFSNPARGKVALIHQSPRAAVNPRMPLRRVITEPGEIAGRKGLDVEVMAAQVGLGEDLLDRHPHEVSDGQLQRACVARALAGRPDYIVADEVTAALDAATTATAIRALLDYSDDHDAGLLLISHDTELLSAVVDRSETTESLTCA